MPLLIFDRGEKLSARAWLQKLQTYLSIYPMDEEGGIKTTSMCLDGISYEWWHNGHTTLGHGDVNSFEDFSRRVLNRF